MHAKQIQACPLIYIYIYIYIYRERESLAALKTQKPQEVWSLRMSACMSAVGVKHDIFVQRQVFPKENDV